MTGPCKLETGVRSHRFESCHPDQLQSGYGPAEKSPDRLCLQRDLQRRTGGPTFMADRLIRRAGRRPLLERNRHDSELIGNILNDVAEEIRVRLAVKVNCVSPRGQRGN
jgi:hypothetical protein